MNLSLSVSAFPGVNGPFPPPASRMYCDFILAAELAMRIVLSSTACQARGCCDQLSDLFSSVALALLNVYQAINGISDNESSSISHLMDKMMTQSSPQAIAEDD